MKKHFLKPTSKERREDGEFYVRESGDAGKSYYLCFRNTEETICTKISRDLYSALLVETQKNTPRDKKKAQIRVYHESDGCESGCCGHVIEVPDLNIRKFTFGHNSVYPPKSDVEWATEVAKEYLKEKHPECLNKIDWNSIDVSEVCEC